MKRRSFAPLAALLVATGWAVQVDWAQAQAERPNIVVIWGDESPATVENHRQAQQPSGVLRSVEEVRVEPFSLARM